MNKRTARRHGAPATTTGHAEDCGNCYRLQPSGVRGSEVGGLRMSAKETLPAVECVRVFCVFPLCCETSLGVNFRERRV